jgi:hypothetical protein
MQLPQGATHAVASSGQLTIEGEILVLLHRQYPHAVPVRSIEDSLKARCSKSVRNALGEMKTNKL